MGAVTRRRAVSASLRAARPCGDALGGEIAARPRRPPCAARGVRVSALFGLGQSLLLALPPERAHDLAVRSLELGLYPRAEAQDDKRLAQRLFGLDFSNPLGMAAGFDKNARVPGPLLGMGFGF